MKEFEINYSIKGVMTMLPLYVTVKADSKEAIKEEDVIKAVQEQSKYFIKRNSIEDITVYL